MNTDKITRFEVIDHTADMLGRMLVKYGVNVEISILIESELVKVLEDVRTHFNMPVIITSGYRSPEYNKKIGGVKNSQHAKGTAADIKVKMVPASKVQGYLSRKYPNKYGIGRYENFTHIDVREKKARWRG